MQWSVSTVNLTRFESPRRHICICVGQNDSQRALIEEINLSWMCITPHQELEPRLSEKKKVGRKPAGDQHSSFVSCLHIHCGQQPQRPATHILCHDGREHSLWDNTSPFFHKLLFFQLFASKNITNTPPFTVMDTGSTQSHLDSHKSSL